MTPSAPPPPRPATPRPFTLTDPLPSGTVMLEASAGTGKTFTIAGLATRWVAETDIRLPQLLVVTFTRSATAELRDRVRTRLVEAADHVEAVLGGAPPDDDDPVCGPITVGQNAAGLRLRHDRLARAISDVDVATISTIHGFCQHILDGLGIASDLDRDAELVESVTNLVEEVVDDLLVETYLAPDDDTPRIGRDALVNLGHTVVANPTTPLVPTDADDVTAALRVRLADRICREVARRTRRRRQLSYDDLLTRLDATLRHADRGDHARQALRQRYLVALIDEFQDTDPVQWSIVSRAFTTREDDPPDDGRALVLIGDPKQAIYAFRGADVHAYLDATRRAGTRYTMACNWRSDAELLRALETLLDGAHFGDADIPFRRVDHAPGHDAPRLVGAPRPVPLRLRHVPRHPSLPVYAGKPKADSIRDLIAADVAADVVELLAARPELVDRDADGEEVGRRRLAPRDVAVLVRTNDQARMVQQSLRTVDVPSVLGGTGSVFTTPAATDWRRLLDALERPASSSRVRALALTSWIGWTAGDLAGAPEEQLDRLHEDVHGWARLLRDAGVAAMFRTICLQRDVPRRLLAVEGGERILADLEHVAELAHAAATTEHLGTGALVGWFRDRVGEADDESSDERLRRLETDHDAVQVLTIHGAKGLEFPVVYVPFLWTSNTGLRGDAPVFHDDTGQRLVDVGGSTHPDHGAHKAAAEAERQAEELRLLYVALTRARHQVVAWYVPAGVPEWSGLGRMLMNRDGAGPPNVDLAAPLPDDDEIASRLTDLATAGDGTIAVETVPEHPDTTPLQNERADDAPLERARFTRTLDGEWRRTSYSGLTSLEEATSWVGSEPSEPVKDDEGDDAAVAGGTDPADTDPHGLREVVVPLDGMPGGAQVGTFVHAVLEHVDFTSDDLWTAIGGAVDDQLRRRRVQVDRDQLVTGLRAAVTTPLGPTAGGIILHDLGRGNRRDEVAFELPLHRGDGRPATMGDLAGLLTEHLPADDPLAGYPATLPPVLRRRTLRGFLAGSIDLVIRRDTDDGPVFHVADHKTNRLGTWGHPLTAWDYRQAALADEMAHGDYPIQALLYSVALHRMLRWRMPGYDPVLNLGSVLYLFLRGMAGSETPAPDGKPCGVFAWQPPATLVTATSDLLHGVSR